MMPTTTTNSGPGITFNLFAKGCCSKMRMIKETTVIKIAPLVM